MPPTPKVIDLYHGGDTVAKAGFNAGWNAALEEAASIAGADLKDADGTHDGSMRHAEAIRELKVDR